MTPKILLCIDCGGSKTSAVLASSETGTIIARTLGGPSNFTYLGVKDFVAVIQETLNRSLASHLVLKFLQDSHDSRGEIVPITLPVSEADSPFHSAWIGVSGVDTPSDAQEAAAALSTLLGIPPGARLQVTNDTHLLAAPLSTQSTYPSCMTVVAGTGSCIVSFRKAAGNQVQEMARTGGYGWILGDEGGGFHVGRETVRALCTEDDVDRLRRSLSADRSKDAPDTRRPTRDLRSLVLAHFGLPPTSLMSDVFRELYAPDPNPTLASVQIADAATSINGHLLMERQQRLSRLTPLVFKAAFPPSPPSINEQGFVPHPIAYEILHTCASELASKMALLLSSPSEELVTGSKYIKASESLLCLGGSLVKQPPYRDLLASILKKMGHEFAQVLFVDDCEHAGIQALFAQATAGT